MGEIIKINQSPKYGNGTVKVIMFIEKVIRIETIIIMSLSIFITKSPFSSIISLPFQKGKEFSPLFEVTICDLKLVASLLDS